MLTYVVYVGRSDIPTLSHSVMLCDERLIPMVMGEPRGTKASGGTSVNQTVNAREAPAWLLLGLLQDGHPVLQSASHHHESGRGSLDYPPRLRGATGAHSGMQGMSVLGKYKTLSDV